MGKALRYSLAGILSLVVAAFGATLFEPFATTLLRRLGVDTSDWVDPMIDVLTEPFAWLVFLLGLTVGAWFHWGATKLDRRAQVVTASERLQARAVAIADNLATRIRYVDRILEAGNQGAISKWKRKIDTQRVPFSALSQDDDAHLALQAARKFNLCRMKHDEFDRCIDNIREGKGYRTNAQAAGMYRQRAQKLHDALADFVTECGHTKLVVAPAIQSLPDKPS